MGSIKVHYLIERSGNRFYWNPKKEYLIGGRMKRCPWTMIRLKADNEIAAAAEAEAYNEQLREWRQGEEVEICLPGSVQWLVGEYKKSPRYKALALATQNLYLYTFPAIISAFRRVPAAKVTRQMAMELYEKLMAQGKKRTPSQVMQVARVVFQYGEDKGIIGLNPFTRQRVAKAKPRRAIFTPEQIADAKEAALAAGLPSVARAIEIGASAGQRPGDIRTLLRTAYDGKWMRVEQSKTGAVVDIPVYKMPELQAELESMTHASVLILHEERTGKPYSKDMLCRRVREVFAAAGLGSDVQFRDLRRTAVVRMAEAECTVPEICSYTGHSLAEANEILEVYLPRTRKMAENAADKVMKMEKKV